MVAVLFIFVAATFRAPLPKPMPNYLSGLNFYGYSSIASMPISLFSATVFSEAMWQRCWATVDKRCATQYLARCTHTSCLKHPAVGSRESQKIASSRRAFIASIRLFVRHCSPRRSVDYCSLRNQLFEASTMENVSTSDAELATCG